MEGQQNDGLELQCPMEIEIKAIEICEKLLSNPKYENCLKVSHYLKFLSIPLQTPIQKLPPNNIFKIKRYSPKNQCSKHVSPIIVFALTQKIRPNVHVMVCLYLRKIVNFVVSH